MSDNTKIIKTSFIKGVKMYFDNIKWKMQHKVNSIKAKFAMSIVRNITKNSTFIKYAKSEFDIAFKNRDEMQDLMCNNVLDLLSVIATQGHSGFSFEYMKSLLTKLMSFKPISKLTFEDDEFNDIGGGIYQNKRNSAIFKYSDGSMSYNYALSYKCVKRIDDNCIVEDGNETIWRGSLFIVDRDKSIYRIKDIRIKNKDKFNFEESCIDAYDLQYPEGWHITFAKESDMDEFNKNYTYTKDYDALEEEYKWKDGIYADMLSKLVHEIYIHMYDIKEKRKRNKANTVK